MADDEEAPPAPVWEGEFTPLPEGLPTGKGVMRYPPPPLKEDEEEEKAGDTYEGFMVQGKRQGMHATTIQRCGNSPYMPPS